MFASDSKMNSDALNLENISIYPTFDSRSKFTDSPNVWKQRFAPGD